MSNIRVLVVDDSAVQRMLLSDALSGQPELELAGTASDGIDALAKVEKLKPDIVILDLEMPKMGGLEAIPKLRRLAPMMPILVYSALTSDGARATIDALSSGAADYLCKPSAGQGKANPVAYIRESLIPKIHALCRARAERARLSRTTAAAPTAASAAPAKPAPARRRITVPPRILAVGSSTGGPQALGALVSGLAPGFPIPLVITQHMPVGYTKPLAERLSTLGPIPIVEAEDGMQIEPGHGYVAPGGFHMLVTKAGRVKLDQRECGYNRPSVDLMFESLPNVVGGAILAVILTGMGSDGAKGAACIREAGGVIIAQDQATSIVWGMPGAVVKADLADAILPLNDIAHDINRRIGSLAKA